jgi:hypothetical protein
VFFHFTEVLDVGGPCGQEVEVESAKVEMLDFDTAVFRTNFRNNRQN